MGRVFLACLAMAWPLQAAPRIAEFMASNSGSFRDEDGSTSDWIEIFNPDAVPVALAGWSLTDDAAQLRQWLFPDVTLGPGQSLVVWASNKNRRDPAAPLHTNFELAADGEYLALVAPDGVTVASAFAPYPPQVADRTYGQAAAFAVTTPITQGTAARWRVPSAAISGWESRTFDDSTWTAGACGIGYDRQTAGVNYLPLLGSGGNVESAMFGIRQTVYIRIPFNVAAPQQVSALRLRMKFDDGYAAFLNGVRLNPPAASLTNAPATLSFSSGASAVRPDADAIVFQETDLAAQLPLLVDGTNVLAIQGLNAGASSSDMLIHPELEIVSVDPAAPLQTGFYVTPTPGNPPTAPPVDGFVDAPDFSTDRGFFTAPVAVTLTSRTPGASIRYTTDGSAPTTTTGTLYTGPVTVSGSSPLRAIAFRAGWAPSVVKTHSYLFPAQTVAQPGSISGYPTTWGNVYDFLTGQLVSGVTVPADYRMDTVVTQDPQYAPRLVPALTSTLPVVALATPVAGVFGTSGIYANGRITDGLEVPVSIEYFHPVTGEKFQEDAGLRIHGGNAPIEHPKKPFRVYFRRDYGAPSLRFPLFPDSPVERFDTLQLRPGGHDGWSVPFGSSPNQLAYHATYCRDRFMRGTETEMGRISPRGRYVHLYINGLYWGVYDLHEVPNSDFFADHIGGEKEDWDVIQNPRFTNEFYGMVDGNNQAFEELLALCRPPTRLADPAVYDQVRRFIDPEAFADHLIVQMWGGQNDWMGPVFRSGTGADASRFFNKNWDTGRRSRGTPLTPFFFNVWDAEISMGSHLTALVTGQRIADFDHTQVGTPSPIASRRPGPPAEIYHALRQNPAFRMMFADRLQRHLFNGGVLAPDRNRARLDRLVADLSEPIILESARWGDVNSGDPDIVTFTRDGHWLPEINWLRDTYIPGRNATLLSQFRSVGIWPDTPAPALSLPGGTVPSGSLLTITHDAGPDAVVYYTLDGSDPMTAPVAERIVLSGPSSPASWKVPAAQYPQNSWKSQLEPEDIATWHSGSAALGYGATAGFPEITGTPVTGMQGVNSSLYVRIPFTLTPAQRAGITQLTLDLRYDDGAFVFVNGSIPLQRLSAPITSPFYTDRATSARTGQEALTPVSLDLTSAIPSLTAKRPNVLALQGLNASATDPDFLLVPELSALIIPEPAPSPSAIRYNGPVPLTSSVNVRARVLSGGQWSPIIEQSYLVGVPAARGNLVISEFSYNPAPPSATEADAGFTAQQFEFIELFNPSPDPVELAGVHFDDGVRFAFPLFGALAIGPGQRLVLVADAAAFALRHPGIPIAGVFADGSNLSNGGERIELLAADGSTIVDFVYNDSAPWPTLADGSGFSLVLVSPSERPDESLPQSWRLSTAIPGAPGSPDDDSFAAWAQRLGYPADPDLDPDRNGLSLAIEYAMGIPPGGSLDAAAFSARLEGVVLTTGPEERLVVRHLRRRGTPDIILTPEVSSDLVLWEPLTMPAAPPVPQADGTDALTWLAPLPAASARTYVRLAARPR